MPASVPSFGVITINNAVPIGCTSPLAVAGYVNVRHQRSAAEDYESPDTLRRASSAIVVALGDI